ncbi:MAG: SHOCT domain-containing protein [Burkholderiaceae bacterium]|nr:MAG: SHOCT domain-containing protein [Burkholderiaceae bacterium]TAM09686.1 MAG: SHOCT domain-containing protein [Pusillimonas sp.]
MMWANMMGGQGCAGLGMLGMGIFWILIIALIFMLIWRVLGYGHNCSHDTPLQKTALDILREHYAAGEMGRGEFQQKMRDFGV